MKAIQWRKKWNDVSENWDKYGWIESGFGNVNKQMEVGLLRFLKCELVFVFCAKSFDQTASKVKEK